jgi:hypothetical protein
MLRGVHTTFLLIYYEYEIILPVLNSTSFLHRLLGEIDGNTTYILVLKIPRTYTRSGLMYHTGLILSYSRPDLQLKKSFV